MFEDGERITLLMLLWNFKQEATHAMESGAVPVEQMEAGKARLESFDAIVKKLGGDPTKPAFGANDL
jgi:hypothetical protein